MTRPTLYAFEFAVGGLRQYGQVFSTEPASVVALVADRYRDTWLASSLPATVSAVGSGRIRPDLVQEVRA